MFLFSIMLGGICKASQIFCYNTKSCLSGKNVGLFMKSCFYVIIVSLLLQGCGAILVGGAATTASVVHDRRSAGTIVDDNTLEIKVEKAISDNKLLADNSHVSATGYNGMVLLTGEAFNDNICQQIAATTKALPGVKRVENQIVIGRRSSFMERAYDSKQTAKVKAALWDVKITGFDPSRVKVVTEHGYTYLLGLVSEEEANAVIGVARRVSGVKEIVSMFEITANPITNR